MELLLFMIVVSDAFKEEIRIFNHVLGKGFLLESYEKASYVFRSVLLLSL